MTFYTVFYTFINKKYIMTFIPKIKVQVGIVEKERENLLVGLSFQKFCQKPLAMDLLDVRLKT